MGLINKLIQKFAKKLSVEVKKWNAILANAVILKDIAACAIVGGTPAQVIKYRFSNGVIDKLLDLNWWDWPIERIRKNKSLFQKDKILIEDFDSIID